MTHKELVRKLIDANKVSMEELLDFEDSVWNELDISDYRDKIDELEDLYYRLNIDEAREIVRGMRPFGEYWTCDNIRSYMRDNDLTENLVDLYLAMNMARNDYYKTAAAYGHQDDPEFYYNIAHDFICDEDAKPHKVARYFL